MDDYPLIANHGLVGDLQTAALISTDGVVDWWCAPRFDSPSIFASLLDTARGGHCRLAAVVEGDAAAEPTVRQLYLPDTAILVTRFMTEQGVGEVADFMLPDESAEPKDRHCLFRVARVVRGSLPFEFACRPRFDYGRSAPTALELDDAGGAVIRGAETDLAVHAIGPATLERDGTDVTARFVLTAGQLAVFMLTSMPAGGVPAKPLSMDEARAAFDTTRRFWAGWLRHSTYHGRWQQMVNRSAISIKLMTYAPSGAPIAAATMGLPEQIGGERNWDYRFTWVRDASLSVRALTALGFQREALDFRRWLRDRLVAGETASGEPLQIMYRVDGDPHLTEEVLEHLEGYRGSAPVRAGNAAADQIQLDIYGEAAYAFGEMGDIGAVHGWRAMVGLLDWLCDHWDRPDEGIWETRGGRRDFTYSRLMTWVAFDRGVRLAREHARPADLVRWTAVRDEVFNQILDRAWDAERGAFVQSYGGTALDASLLLMPRVGFITPTDPAWLSTLDAMAGELVSDSLVYRYDPGTSPDGLRGSEGTFNLCTFLYVEALAQAGRIDEARYAFDKMLTYANHVGLFAEEIGPSGEQLGNFPQAFTHLALISAALVLDEKLDRAEA
ncbi:glycoside hydrolase family 15 protein [Actinospica durhamensis]|uniref:Glycoside hydrolase family 15 protein n=1 Tax=Actinospica durhamensis TaxID=1508375 RepID=A0A941ENU4_9ACTN|nr:glycoside hydrolase family 15 protein [Actinospica durhamensis]MBR7833808.1 glycoside hydrolase family 15 protein [Actinospica durhamensis]